MHKVTKVLPRRIAAVVLIVFLTLLALLPMAGCSVNSFQGDSKQLMEKLGITAQLTENGDMKVKEIWKVDLSDRGKPYRNMYRSFSLDPGKADGIADLAVYDEDNKKEYQYIGDVDPEGSDFIPDNTCYQHNTAQQTEIGWFMPAVDEGVRTFTVSYTVKNLVAVHRDTAVLYNFFVPNNFSLPIAELTGTVQFPNGGSLSDVHAWLHSTAQGNLTRDSASQISFRVQKIPAETSVEVRLCMPPQLFPSAQKTDTQTVLPQIEQDEKKWASDYAAEQYRLYLLGIFDAVSAVVVLIIGIAVLVIVKRKNRRLVVGVPEYTREIPEGNSPAGIANLFYFYSGGVTEKEQGRVFSATLLSLAHKGYVKFNGNGDDNFTVTITGDTKKIPLTESEQIFFNMISTVADHYDNSFTMKQFRQYAETGYRYIDSNMNTFLSTAKREISNRGYYQTKPLYLTTIQFLGGLLLAAAFFLFFITGTLNSLLLYLPLSVIITGVLMLIAGSSKQKLSEIGEYDYGVWHGLKKYMLEFSRMKEYGVPQLELWEEYLVYATMMGISKHVCDQLKLVYPELNDEAYVNTYFGGSYMFYMFGPRFGGYGFAGADFGTSLASTISDISSAATRLTNPPPSNNNFGGGGFGGGSFGGGGGGFGGGGGGGVR